MLRPSKGRTIQTLLSLSNSVPGTLQRPGANRATLACRPRSQGIELSLSARCSRLQACSCPRPSGGVRPWYTGDMITHLSFSGMKTYRTCSEQYRLEKAEGLPQGAPGWYNIGGTAVHSMTEADDVVRFTGTPHGKTFNDFFDEVADEAEAESGVPRSEWRAAGRKTKADPIGEGEVWWRTNGPSFVASWARWLNNSPFVIYVTPDGEPAIELQYEQMIGEVPNKGTIDRVLQSTVDGSLGVVDLKTGKEPDDALQLGTYAEHCRSVGWPTNWGGYWMARTGILSGMHDMGPFTGERLRYDYEQAWHGIQAGIYPAKPSGLCKNHCGVAQYCYAGGQLRDPSYVPFQITPEV
jgi:putative RecB family exonuclease